MLFVQPSSAAAERVLSLLSASFNEQQVMHSQTTCKQAYAAV